MPVKEVLTSARVPVKIWTEEVDDRSREQLSKIASLPFIHHHVAAMPDVHLGIGATIGSVIGRLEKKGWLRRQPDVADRRRKLLWLTPEGERGAGALKPLPTTSKRTR